VSIDAWLELVADGGLFASDAVNIVNARFTITGAGFDVSEAATTLVGYGGNNAVELAAIAGIRALTMSSPAVSSAASSDSQAQPVHVTVLSADRVRLTVQAGGVRLAFVRSAPAGK
jgi:hypothetical protein